MVAFFKSTYRVFIWAVWIIYVEINCNGQELTNSTEFLTVTEGGNVTLPCTARNISDKKVFWFQTEGYPLFVLNKSHIGDDRFELGRLNDDDWSLTIHEAREWDAGSYRCLLNTKPVQMKTLHLNVLVSAKINKTVSSTNMNVFEGEDVELYCDVRGNPEPLVGWLRNGEFVSAGNNLTLHDVTCASSGTYTCIASNHVGKAVHHNLKVAVCTNSAEGTFHRLGVLKLLLFLWCISSKLYPCARGPSQ